MLIYLIGYMYSGKTTFGRQLATRLGYEFLDLDQYFEQRYRTTIPIFFQRYGEQAFRILERQLLHTTEHFHDTVVSTGGGTPCQYDNIEWINRQGISVFMDTPVEVILQRAAGSKKVRPILANKTPDERASFVADQLQQRLPYYRQAHIHFGPDQPLESIAETILAFGQHK